MVLLKHPYLETADWMIQDIEPNRAYYSIIKSKALSKVSRCGVHMGASYALAGFKKQEDVQILKENFCSAEDVCTEWAFRAIETFPDTAFYPVLISYFENVVTKKKQSYSDDLRYFCQALAQYKTATSLSILTALTKKETYPDSWYLPQNREYVFRAIHKYYSPPYKKIYQELKPTMSANVMEYLDKPAYDEYRTW
ncbi:MAG: hypothetical protein EOO06_12435 [Chitinophagaceae bacterium]|nr:MAG: hypothetical protein EOO06_12435 [Chitinophagaceae bacterium]